MRTRRSLRVILNGERPLVLQPNAHDRIVVEVPVRDFHFSVFVKVLIGDSEPVVL